MFTSRTSKLKHAISQAVTIAIVVIVVIIVAAGGYYALTLPKGSTSTTTTTTSSASSSTTTSASSSTTTTTTTTSSTQNLTALAEAEGSVTIYGLVDQSAMTPMISAFQSAYPWAKVNYVSYASGDLLNKVLAEEKAGTPGADVIEVLLSQVPTLENHTALQAWCNPEEKAMNYSAAFVDPNCFYHPFTGNLALLMYNTNMVKNTSTLPTSWTDINNSKYKGQFAIDNPARLSTAGAIFAWIGENESYGQWVNWMEGVKANQPLITSSLGTLYTDVSTGQVAFGIDTSDDAIPGVASGAPISYRWLNPIFVGYFPFAIEKGDAHPYMAELWINWVTSMQGQLATGKIGRLPILSAAAKQTFYVNVTIPIPSSYAELPYGYGNHFYTNTTGYSAVYTQIFGAVG